MTIRPSDLPDFSNPPVVETVLSVQFERLSAARTAHFGLYWNEIKGRFPITEERGELPPVVEQPPGLPSPGVGIQFEALQAPPTPRFWFANEGRTELIQLQRDRFIKNWQKTGEGNQYPRYERVKEGFERDFSDFINFVARHQLGAIRANQCEVTYVNHIVAGKGWSSHADISKVFSVWRQPETVYPGPAQDLMFHAGFPILDNSGAFVGRLHATVQSVMRLSDGVPMFVLDLTARGQVGDGTAFFDLGREWIVRSFKELTTPEMHKIWGIRS
ncbi:MAG: TIGR04255 family protein [Acidobacteriaceae bacterium]